MKARTIAWEIVSWDVVAGVVVAAVGTLDPDERDWRKVVQVVSQPGTMRFLLHSHGGMPTRASLALLREPLLDTVPVAVLTDGAPWSNRRIRCYPTSAVDEALNYLCVLQHRRDLVTAALRTQRIAIGSIRV
jgi:hypothetical protein